MALISLMALPIALPLPADGMAHCRTGDYQELLAVAGAAVIFPPVHLSRIGTQVRPGEMMVGADLSAAKATEEAFGLIGATNAIAIDLRMVDPPREKTGL